MTKPKSNATDPNLAKAFAFLDAIQLTMPERVDKATVVGEGNDVLLVVTPEKVYLMANDRPQSPFGAIGDRYNSFARDAVRLAARADRIPQESADAFISWYDITREAHIARSDLGTATVLAAKYGYTLVRAVQ